MRHVRTAKAEFELKQRVNLFVLEQLSQKTGKTPTEVAGLLPTKVHEAIGKFASVLVEELDRECTQV